MMSSLDLPVLFDLIQTRLALTLDDHRRQEVLRAVDEWTSSGIIRDPQGLVRTLSQQPTTYALWQEFIQIATIGETYFFRDRDQLNALRCSVLPDLIQERRREGKLRLHLWSAGCSTGEEPYSLAILVRELLPDFRAWDVHILATDLNVASLEYAHRGVYRPRSFRSETPEEIRQQWFIDEQGNYRITPSIQDMVTFLPLNLVSDDYPSPGNGTTEIDVIVCRNVLIYFDKAAANTVVSRFYCSLRQRGWLVLGHAESGHIGNNGFKPNNFENAVLYRKDAPHEQASLNRPVLLDVPADPVLFLTEPDSRPVVSAKPDRNKSGSVAAPDPLEQARRAADKEQWAEALHWLAEAEKLQKLRPEVHYLRGVIEVYQQERDKAAASLRQAIYCDRGFVLAYLALGEIYEQQGQYEQASHQWNQARAILCSLPPLETIAFSNDVTVEMMIRLLQFRIRNLPAKD